MFKFHPSFNTSGFHMVLVLQGTEFVWFVVNLAAVSIVAVMGQLERAAELNP